MTSQTSAVGSEPQLRTEEHEDERSLLGNPIPAMGTLGRGPHLLLLAGPALLLCTFVATIDLSYMAANYSRRIADDLGQIGNAAWLVTGYLITESAFQPMYAQLGLYKGHRFSLLVAASLMSSGLLLCSVSQTLWQLAFSRAVVGLGAAGLELLVLIIINDHVNVYSLPLWRSIVTAVSTVASFLGPSVGAEITESVNFRLFFALEFFLMLIGAIATIFTLRLPVPNGRAFPSSAGEHRMDWVGAGLLLAAVSVLLLIINLGGQALPWSSPIMIVLVSSTPIFIMVFIQSQLRRQGPKLVPFHFLRNKSVLMVFACGLPAWLSWDQLKYGLGQYVEARAMRTSSSSGFNNWALSCVFVGIPLGNLLSGVIIQRYHALRLLLRVVSVLNLLTYACFAAGFIHPENPAFVPVLGLVGLNIGVLDSCWLVSIFSSAAPEDQPALYAFFDLGRANTGNVGIAVALASTNAMIRSMLESALVDYPDKEDIIRKSLQSLGAIRHFPVSIQHIVLDAFISSSEKAFMISCCVLVISVIAAFLA